MTFGGFGPSTLPEGDARRASNMVRDAIEAAYARGRSDGSRYGSIGGSRLGSVHATVTPSPSNRPNCSTADNKMCMEFCIDSVDKI